MPVMRRRFRNPEAIERRVLVVRRRAAGATYNDIATELGISGPRACQLFNDGMEYLTQELALEAAKVRIIEVERLEGLIQELLEYRKVNITGETEGGDPIVLVGFPNLEVYDRIFKAIGQKAKMLGVEIIAREEQEGRMESADTPWQKFLADVVEFKGEIEAVVAQSTPNVLEATAKEEPVETSPAH